MGRDAGWLTLHAGIASGADAILIPEIPYDVNKIADLIARRDRAGRGLLHHRVRRGALYPWTM